MKGTRVPKGLQGAPPLLCLVWASLKIRISVHLFQRWFQKTAVRSGEVKQRMERKKWRIHYQAITTMGSGAWPQWEYWERAQNQTQSYLAQGQGGSGTYIPTPEETGRDIGRRGHSFPDTLSLPHSRQIALGTERALGQAQKLLVFVHRNGEYRGDLATPQYSCICHTHPCLHLRLDFHERRKVLLFS